jgi:hypothetical protein
VPDAEPGHLVIDYSAHVDGRLPVPDTSEYDLLSYRRPSRYVPSDRFLSTAAAEFGQIDASRSWPGRWPAGCRVGCST